MWTRLILLGLLALAAVQAYALRKSQQTVDALIELNHSKSVYIDAGCATSYKGAEELLPGEAIWDDSLQNSTFWAARPEEQSPKGTFLRDDGEWRTPTFARTLVYVYDSKKRPAFIYVDENLTIPSPNPFLVEKDGSFVLAVAKGKYTIKLREKP